MTVSSGISVQRVEWAGCEAAIRAVRLAVFVREQGIPAELEWDGRDAVCLHVLARHSDGTPVGTARMQAEGHIGRMAVLAAWRGRGIGGRLLETLVASARERRLPEVWLSAQSTAIPFYIKHGFSMTGDEYIEAGLPHRWMRRILVTPA